MVRFIEPEHPRDQLLLLPPSVDQFVPVSHEVRLFDALLGALDFSPLLAAYPGGGAPAYDPRMLMRVVVYGFWRGIRSSREMAKALRENLAFMWLAQMQQPSYVTIARFIQSHSGSVHDILTQTVVLAKRLDLVPLAHVAVDGTAIEANVSGKRCYSGARLERELAYIEEQMAVWAQRDAMEDEIFGDRSGDDLPDDLGSLMARKERLEEADRERQQIDRKSIAITDPESRFMRVHGALRPCFNAQAAVDADTQIIVAAEVLSQETDNGALPEMVEQVAANTGQMPQDVLADCGYGSQATYAYAQRHSETQFLIAQQRHATDERRLGFSYDGDRDVWLDKAGREHPYWSDRVAHSKPYRVYRARGYPKSEYWQPVDDAFIHDLKAKLASPEGRALYNLRRQSVEPVFGFIKTRMNMRRLLRRGRTGACSEWFLACIAHNIGKMARYAV